jgi:glycosyltransferase involved in cell wall biosynthesis
VQGWQDESARPPSPHELHRYPLVRLPRIGEGAVRAASIRARLRAAGSRRPELVHAHFLLGPGAGAARLAKRWGTPLVLTAHGTDVAFLEGSLPPRLRGEVEGACRSADLVLCVSDDLKERLAALVPEARIEVLPMGVASDVFRPRERGQNVPQSPFVLFAGRATTEKGIEVLEEAVGRLHDRGVDVPVYIAGPAGVALARTHALGVLGRAELADWMSAAAVTCLPSFSEGSPLVVAESLASGTPVVASAVGGIPAMVSDGENGFLVPPGHPGALADALAAALDRSWQQQEIRASSTEFWCATIARRLAGYYEELLPA